MNKERAAAEGRIPDNGEPGLRQPFCIEEYGGNAGGISEEVSGKCQEHF